ncbi:hypothetical protein EV580_3148 [Mycobacterium sp. BK086]|uniref:hypothetical protein n=1 Tax=Mycobacterium sp. BK086 TaxID=2512165 RepID=UPI001061C09E|nr:hypothetical protein [Mycobacterium sp. BK086]TDO15008.1 hypothetical protein EV580_3148 [Mycobacterium sp. BK086]
MIELAEVFEEHLKALSDEDWAALVTRVRPPKSPPAPPISGERVDDQPPQKRFPQATGPATNEGLAEAHRRGYIDDEGNAR